MSDVPYNLDFWLKNVQVLICYSKTIYAVMPNGYVTITLLGKLRVIDNTKKNIVRNMMCN